MITKEIIEELEKRLQNSVHRITLYMKCIELNTGKIKLNKDEIQEMINQLIELEDYELCVKLQKRLQ